MYLEEAIRAQLLATPALAAMVGERVLQAQVTELTAMPAVTFQRISTSPLNHRGASELGRIRFQVDGWSMSAEDTSKLRQHIKTALSGWQQASDPRVDASILQDDRTFIEPQLERWRASIDYIFFAQEGS